MQRNASEASNKIAGGLGALYAPSPVMGFGAESRKIFDFYHLNGL